MMVKIKLTVNMSLLAAAFKATEAITTMITLSMDIAPKHLSQDIMQKQQGEI